MKKTLYIVLLLILVVIIGSYASRSNRNSQSTSGKSFKIGVILPLSGPAGAMGEASKKSVDLALSKIIKEDRSGVEVVFADDQFDPKQTVSVTQKLIDVDKVDALIVYSSPSSVAASYVAEKSAVPMIGIGNSFEINTDKKWVVRYMLGPKPQADAIESLLLRGKYNKIGMIWNQSDGPKSVHDELVKVLNEKGYKVVVDESVSKNENDFKTSIAKLRSASPDVVVAYISPQIGIFAKQAKDLGLNTPIVSGPPFEIVDQIKASQGGMDNKLFVSNDNIAFIDDYFATYKMYPTIAGDYIYDAITQLVSFSRQENRSKDSLMNYLRKDFSGVSGNYKYISDSSFEISQIIKKWNGEKFEKVN